MLLRIHRFLPLTAVEGPGKRACLWVQGCSIRCPGCAVPETWLKTGGYEMCISKLAHQILEGPPIEGVTFVGGEPFDQAGALTRLAGILRPNGLSVVTFTGYLLENILQSSRKEWHDLLDVTDLLIDGPYIAELSDYSRPWVGSSNQRYHFLTSRYQELKSYVNTIHNKVEIRIDLNGKVMVNGLADIQWLKSLIGRFGDSPD